MLTFGKKHCARLGIAGKAVEGANEIQQPVTVDSEVKLTLSARNSRDTSSITLKESEHKLRLAVTSADISVAEHEKRVYCLFSPEPT